MESALTCNHLFKELYIFASLRFVSLPTRLMNSRIKIPENVTMWKLTNVLLLLAVLLQLLVISCHGLR